MTNALDALEAEQATLAGSDTGSNPPATVESLLAQAEAAGYPQSALDALHSRADLLRRVGRVAQIDVDAEAQAVYDRLPEFRRERAARERDTAMQASNPSERRTRLDRAQQLEHQAQQLFTPDDEAQLRGRALATELSIRLSARLRHIEISTLDVEPSSLRLFERTFQRHAQGVEATTGTDRVQAEHAARLGFLQAMIEVDATPDDPAGLQAAIVQYRKNTTRDYGAEPGHLHDQTLPEHGSEAGKYRDPQAPDPLTLMESREEAQQSAEVARLSRALALVAATELSTRHYAVYQVLAENTHLFDWRLDPEGRLIFQKREGAEKGENIAVMVMQEVGGYSGRGAAYRAVHDTLDRLGAALQKYGRDVTIEDIPVEKQTRATDRLTASRGEILEAAHTSSRSSGKTQRGAKRENSEIE
ncbi:hypothetical protein HMI48_11515 [Acidithiobacillus ferrooxidans]|uniref:hypothetical protein n=1 Tax=Acidithiobacillus ferrooxidans TaxID=920 RepID=UPI001C07E2E9|nr:hypothetical protein [Acidithiobacillus ferrooxidans]MBU2774470.1 hypothetical protein [Acidithiobacillus ferrooxidans]